MTSTTDESVLIADIRAALAAAAEPVRPVGMVLPAPAPRSRSGRRAVIALVAAVVVLLTGITAAILLVPRHDVRTATTIAVSGGIADVGGIRFPLPQGWTAAVVGHTATTVTACVAAAPGLDCDGVTIEAAIPDQWGTTSTVPGVGLQWERACPSGSGHVIQLRDDGPGTTLAGRPGQYTFSSCAGVDDGTDHQWELVDQSLVIYAPPGRFAAQAQDIVSGLDLSAWSHRAGAATMQWTRATSAG